MSPVPPKTPAPVNGVITATPFVAVQGSGLPYQEVEDMLVYMAEVKQAGGKGVLV